MVRNRDAGEIDGRGLILAQGVPIDLGHLGEIIRAEEELGSDVLDGAQTEVRLPGGGVVIILCAACATEGGR